jgi:hypothetical protein
MKKSVLLLVAVIMAVGFTSCYKCEKLGRQIEGTWTKSINNETLTITFTKEGTITITSGSYNVTGRYYFEDVQVMIVTSDCNAPGYYLPKIDKKDVLFWEVDTDECTSRKIMLVGSFNREK